MEIIWRSLYFYFRFPVSLRQVAELLNDRGVKVSHMSILRWAVKFGPDLEEKFRKYKQPVNLSWRIDETYIKIRGEDRYLYRAVDKNGNTVDFLLTARRDLIAAKRFLKKSYQKPWRSFKNQSGYMPLFNQDPQNAYWSLVHAIKN